MEKSFGLCFFQISLILLCFWFMHRALVQIQFQVPRMIPPPNIMAHFTFGYSEVLADKYWIDAIQYFDRPQYRLKNKTSQVSELYSMLDLITEFSPRFQIVYSGGGTALSVLANDVVGAGLIFEKGMKQFPKDWKLTYRAAYHALYEENDRDKAASLFLKTAQLGGPAWAYALSGRLYTEEGKYDVGQKILSEIEKDPEMQLFAERLRQKLESVKK
jgi:hypothetical protein